MSDNKQFNRFKQLLSGGATIDECLFYECNDNLIIIGADKDQVFKLPLRFKSIKKLVLVYSQKGNIIINKTLKDFRCSSIDDSLIHFKLTEEETKRFKEGKVEAQMKVLLEDNSILVSSRLQINAVETLDKLNFSNTDTKINSILITVNEQEAKLVQFSTIAAGSDNTHYCKFVFDSSWDNLSKTAVFRDEYNEFVNNVRIDNNICKIPSTIIAQPGNVYIGVVGKADKIIRPTEWSNSFRVVNSCTYDKFVYNGGPSHDSSDVEPADDKTPGIMKLYNQGGQNIDGAVTQKAITDGFNSIRFDIDEYIDDCAVLKVDFKQDDVINQYLNKNNKQLKTNTIKSSSDIPYADDKTAGIMKLYDIGGQNVDGTVTQRAITDGFNSVKFGLDDYIDECIVLKVDFEQES